MVARVSKLLRWWPIAKMLYLACVVGLAALAIMVLGVIFDTPLWVIGSMSVAQGLGVLAGLMFVISVAADSGRRT